MNGVLSINNYWLISCFTDPVMRLLINGILWNHKVIK